MLESLEKMLAKGVDNSLLRFGLDYAGLGGDVDSLTANVLAMTEKAEGGDRR